MLLLMMEYIYMTKVEFFDINYSISKWIKNFKIRHEFCFSLITCILLIDTKESVQMVTKIGKNDCTAHTEFSIFFTILSFQPFHSSLYPCVIFSHSLNHPSHFHRACLNIFFSKINTIKLPRMLKILQNNSF